jgi:hypothetical protein
MENNSHEHLDSYRRLWSWDCLLVLLISFVNGRDFVAALQAGFGFALLVGFIVALLSCGMENALEKGYPGWFGFLLVLCLNIVGLMILALLPAHTPTTNPTAAR